MKFCGTMENLVKKIFQTFSIIDNNITQPVEQICLVLFKHKFTSKNINSYQANNSGRKLFSFVWSRFGNRTVIFVPTGSMFGTK